jgi:LacI family transcriptional regulator
LFRETIFPAEGFSLPKRISRKRRLTPDRVTIVQVAAHARVSLGTASRALNGKKGVDPALVRRVEQAVAALGYVRAPHARKSSNDGRPIITFILGNRDFLHPVHARLLQGAEEFSEEAGYAVVFKRYTYSASTPAAALTLPAVLRHHRIADCLILAGTNYPNLVEATENARIPYVLYGNNLIGAASLRTVDQVRSDDTSGAVDAVRYLIQLGHRHICFIGDTSLRWFADRHRGYAIAMAEAGLEPIAQTVALSSDNFRNGYSCAEAMLRRRPEITAIFAAGDDVATGVWEHLRQIGRRVPDEVALIGYGDVPGAIQTIPPLTTVRIDYIELGRQLARMAIEKMKSPGVAIPEVVLNTRLMLRGTTWPPHANPDSPQPPPIASAG